ncbi:hypothetical protein RBS60_07520 [Sinomonas sp. ASV486]|uniref:hypothetical protein n=1 Tax=Sinomonas sp. ASV486 TaxID=3051170 RepID=UPI0027DCDB60|nr:hypothetical protein [Sinomonas sp. ASV486]MDQ4490046.1 hypothetical protein [Sinomonas sp. ASV486]
MTMNRTALRALLAEEGLEHDVALSHVLERIAALGAAPAPEPSGPLARFMAASALKATGVGHPRWIKRHRGAVIGVLVAAGMGLGASGVAAVTGQTWPWQAQDWSDLTPAESVHTQAPAPEGTASAVDPASIPAAPAKDKASDAKGDQHAQDSASEGKNSQGQNSQGDANQGQSNQNQNTQGGRTPGRSDSGGQGASGPGGNH